MKSHGIDCSEVLERLPLLPGGDLEPHLAEAVAAHLEGCESCAREAVRLHSALSALGTLRDGPQAGAPAEIDLWPALRATLSAEGRLLAPGRPTVPETVRAAAQSGPVAAHVGRRWVMGRTTRWAAAAAIVAAAVVGWGLWPAGPRSAAPAQGPVALEAQPEAAPAALAAQAGDAATQDEPTAPAGGLRRAPGEERRRDFSVPFDAPGDRNGAWSLAGDRELR